jgi:rubrerythrin
MIEEPTMPTPCRTCAHHLDEAARAEARNHIRLLHLADVADSIGDGELGALLREHAAQEDLHALRLYELAAPDGRDLVTDAPLRSPADILEAALTYARCQGDETSPWYASLAHQTGCEDITALFRGHAEACEEQVADLEDLRARRS